VTSVAPGLLVVWTNIGENLDRDFNEWYNRSHLRERILDLPEFVRGRRFVAFDGGPRYLALYETRSTAAFHSEPYLALKRNFDPQSSRFVPHFRDTLKVAGQIVAYAGVAEGSVIALIPIAREAGREDALREVINADFLARLLAVEGVVAAWYAERDAAAVASAIADHPRATDRILDAMLVIECTSAEAMNRAAPLIDWVLIQAHGGKPDVPQARFRLACAVHRPPGAHASTCRDVP